MKKAKVIISSMAVLLTVSSFARENMGMNKHVATPVQSLMAVCTAGAAQTDLDINNVRTTILTSGDMWWDLSNPKYEIPKGSGVHSVFAGALWIGGIDAGAQLREACMTYRQNGGPDFWPGPLDPATISTNSATVCSDYDKHYKITKEEVELFLGGGPLTDAIANWPVTSAFGQPLAPYYDADNSGTYDPTAGDYPDYDVYGNRGCSAQLHGDQTLFWVFNDKGNGNTHVETGGLPIGLEIQAQAFGFQTNDEINNMTFYNYTIINRSTFPMNDTYFGQWVDSDLGYAFDDYVGCDVRKGLGFTYNGKQIDGSGAPGEYGANPPALGVDFFQGPFADPNGMDDPIDINNTASANGTGYGDSIIDNERLGMVKFVYYSNDFSQQGNPEIATHYYNYLSGLWKDGTPFNFGGDAFHEPGNIVTSFMFPGDSDPLGFGTAGAITGSAGVWSEENAPNLPNDRRFLQSAGPFTLNPGAVNTITTGVLWARATTGGPLASVSLLKAADIKAQALFDNCFQVLNGPDAPDVSIVELDKELILNLSNQPSPSSNNYNQDYKEKDPYIKNSLTNWTFEGYQIYQLKDATVSVTDLDNPDKARLVKQSDIKNNTSSIVNYYLDLNISAWVPSQEVNGANTGIENSFAITQDLFAAGDNKLVNFKTYYYMAVAYGFNPAEIQPDPYTAVDGLNIPYIAGRRNVKVYSAIPHKPEALGTIIAGGYGSGPKITRVEGHGNGNNVVDLTDASVNKILTDSTFRQVEYEGGRGPIQVKVVDPLNVIPGDFTVKFYTTKNLSAADTLKNASWVLVRNGIDSVYSGKLITVPNEKMLSSNVFNWGISVNIYQPVNSSGTIQLPGKQTSDNSGFLEATMTFSNGQNWLSAVQDADDSPSDWIRSNDTTLKDVDDRKVFQTVLSGTWAPYRLVAITANMPAFGQVISSGLNKIQETASIDLVLTPDKSKWTRCVVFEMAESGAKFYVKGNKSRDKNGDSTNTGGTINNSDFVNATGMSWFPGYAINVSTGERLNIGFGEDSSLPGNNGNDMLWNPTDSAFRIVPPNFLVQLFGGKHFIYVFGHNKHTSGEMPKYDESRYIRTALAAGNTNANKRKVFEHAMWVNIPLAASGFNLKSGVPPSEAKIRLRMSGYYQKGYSIPSDSSLTPQNNNLPMYNFSTNDLVAKKYDETTNKNALDLINVVPNPYYAYSAYETNQVDNRIKITNLPEECTVKIYTVNGTLIRMFKKSDTKTYLDWDLKNQANIPIASGLYIIHINTVAGGEKILKWFGVLRPIDLDSF